MAEQSIADFSIFTKKPKIPPHYSPCPDDLLIALGEAEAMMSVVLEDDFMNGDRNRMYHYFCALFRIIGEATRLCEDINDSLMDHFTNTQDQP